MSERRKNSKPKAVWRRQGRAVVPANDIAEDMLASLKDGTDYIGDIHGVRSVKQLRLWWGLCEILVENGVFQSREAASDIVKIACEHVDMRIDPCDGKVTYVPKSIAFESLAQHEFNEILNRAIDKIIERWCQGWDREALLQQVFDAIDTPEKRALGRRAA
jgi:hypothetical protein